PERYFLPEVMGGGIAWCDFDGDGLLDLYVRDGCRLDAPESTPPDRVSRLLRNLGDDRFIDVTFASGAGFECYGQGCAVGDYDADGFADLFFTNYGCNGLLHYNGDGTFSDSTAIAGVADNQWGTSAAWFDADTDGFLDLYVVNYMDVTLANSKQCE